MLLIYSKFLIIYYTFFLIISLLRPYLNLYTYLLRNIFIPSVISISFYILFLIRELYSSLITFSYLS